VRFEAEVAHAAGAPRSCVVTCVPVLDDEGETVEVVVLLTPRA
jgi:hypothetical protein